MRISPRERPNAAKPGQVRLGRGERRAWRVAVVVVAALTLAPLASGSEGPRPDDPQRMLLGLVVDNRELSASEVYFDGNEFLLPLDDFLAVCSCQLTQDGDQITIETPLGNVILQPADIVASEGVAHLRERAMIDRLAMRVSYSSSRLALLLDIPWVGPRFGETTARRADPVADTFAPSLALSTAQIRARRSQRRDLGVSSADTVLSGRAAGGQWRIRYDESFAERRRLSEYAWLRRFDDKLVMAGYQRVSLHPMLSGIEMTGLQGAWTNQPFELFSVNASGTELLPRQMRSDQRGRRSSGHRGPPGQRPECGGANDGSRRSL